MSIKKWKEKERTQREDQDEGVDNQKIKRQSFHVMWTENIIKKHFTTKK